jgi:hypothetical protein
VDRRRPNDFFLCWNATVYPHFDGAFARLNSRHLGKGAKKHADIVGRTSFAGKISRFPAEIDIGEVIRDRLAAWILLNSYLAYNLELLLGRLQSRCLPQHHPPKPSEVFSGVKGNNFICIVGTGATTSRGSGKS